jgi:hypothetical protein
MDQTHKIVDAQLLGFHGFSQPLQVEPLWPRDDHQQELAVGREDDYSLIGFGRRAPQHVGYVSRRADICARCMGLMEAVMRFEQV